ncbi:short chain dehydrogenase/reductase family oxidoreductase [Hyphomonas polymorpha PS728]|uniref:Short chain dehydrogenase/reductase family oxidoreductase n=1 Tax=Hyphomonas polymorpha PS728 TaxID=1280954 RepID=A0A062VCD8_9PROT|nr:MULTISPECIES: SDR family oxidoreductase [Hyphomonas]AXE62986.1 short chain dehydrogenase [Hyphomonas sp. CACIAM 19H1]KDA00147.1 short chain dehydrogenase/reductase family oxidoreductase [Hyphomonas polymorpha PS728]
MTPGGALVTGAGGRLGRAMALALGTDGWTVAVHYRGSAEGAQETAALIRAAGGKAEIVACDLSDERQRADLFGQIRTLLGMPVTLLVNSASTFTGDSAASHTREDWDHHFEPNLRAPVHLAQQLATHLPEGERGLVVNLIDQKVLKLNPLFFTYTLSKAALWQATQTLAQGLAPQVRVNAIAPGPTLQSVHQTPAQFAAEKAATLTGEGGSPEEIVRALRYLVSASSVTGQMIACDGGQHLMWQTPDTQI